MTVPPAPEPTYFCQQCMKTFPQQIVKKLREDTFIHEIAVYLQNGKIEHLWHQVHERTWGETIQGGKL